MRKGFKRLVTIIFIPHSQRNSYNLRIPLAIFYSLILLSTGAIILSGLFLFKFREFTQTRRANLELLNEVAKIRKTMVDVRGLEARLKTLTGTSRVIEVATGGPAQENLGYLTKRSLFESQKVSLFELEKRLEGERLKETFLPSISPVKRGWFISKSLEGLEIASLPGSAVRATAGGRVLHASKGKVMIDHGNSLKTGYENLESISVKVGERLRKGETIGYLGKKGISYQIKRFDKKIDPLGYMNGFDNTFSGMGR